MPKLINYLAWNTPSRTYNGRELAALQNIYEQACQTLDIGLTDDRRPQLAALIFDLAESAGDLEDQAECETLLRRVTAAFSS